MVNSIGMLSECIRYAVPPRYFRSVFRRLENAIDIIKCVQFFGLKKKRIFIYIYYMHFVVGQTTTIIINATTTTSPPQQYYYLIINQTRSCTCVRKKTRIINGIHRNVLDLLFNRRRYRLGRCHRPPPSRTADDRVPRSYRAV